MLAYYAEREQTRESLFSPKGRGWGGNVNIFSPKRRNLAVARSIDCLTRSGFAAPTGDKKRVAMFATLA